MATFIIHAGRQFEYWSGESLYRDSGLHIHTVHPAAKSRLILKMTMITYDVKHDVVTQAGGAINADQNAIFDGGAEAHRQPVCPCARPLVIGPGVCDQPTSFTKDVRGARCGEKKGRD